MKNETMTGVEDGLPMNEDVGSWTAEKYRQIQIYSHIFTTGMKGKWSSLVYLDLYSGSGQSRVEKSREILLGSPLIALSLDNQFHRYVLCEKDPSKLAALKQRVGERFPGINVSFVNGDCDDPSFQIGESIPSGALTLCFVDPYKLDIRFSTLRRLSQGRNIDFLCLLASRMDGGRNVHNYTKEESTKIDHLLDSTDWRENWEKSKEGVAREQNFGDFVCREFSRRMESIGYLPTEMHELRPIKTDGGVVIYHLALFSKSKVAKGFWRRASTYSQPQRGFQFD